MKPSRRGISELQEVVPADLFTTALHHQKGVKWLHEIFERSAAKFPDRPCFRLAGEGTRTLTYQEFAKAGEAVKALLVDRTVSETREYQVEEVGEGGAEENGVILG